MLYCWMLRLLYVSKTIDDERTSCQRLAADMSVASDRADGWRRASSHVFCEAGGGGGGEEDSP
jgi:hypothetical protein